MQTDNKHSLEANADIYRHTNINFFIILDTLIQFFTNNCTLLIQNRFNSSIFIKT